ncbi:MAG: signal peptide peptidase SppA [Candidatus Competibacteraceae bacterium]|nr:signal peptide peptidase SppA [Candidatus Competibacteraceae bacterium]MCB1821268.1 signal peptide peptidase SppA [Candidatus Competibacteraceae bacterium]HRY15797.1 signal peptide peptidase SppA [Candidatus Competibacteraceae bacterium]
MNELNPNTSPPDDERWARDTLTKLAFAAVTEQRRARRWGIFFKCLFFGYLVLLLVLAWPDNLGKATASVKKHTALIRVEGLISSNTEASAKNIVGALRKAFKDDNTVGVILQINSPGGSPVQAGEIYDEIWKLREQHPKIPVHAVVSDVCASGGYYIAAAAQNIYANQASIVGSIGVRMDSFGFTEAIAKLGVERRAYTAGANKDFLDPFKPVNPEEVQHLQGMLDAIHQQFIKAVKQGRGERLKDHPEIFSGLMWTGAQSVEFGLVDALGSTRYVAEEVIGEKSILDYTQRTGWIERLLDEVEASAGAALREGLSIEGMPQWR